MILIYLIILILLIVLLCVAIRAVSQFGRSADKTSLGGGAVASASAPAREEKERDTEFERAWDVDSRYDPMIRAQVERLTEYGSQAVEELKRVYRVTGDKENLESVADRIIADIQAGKFKEIAEEEKYQGWDRLSQANDLESLRSPSDGTPVSAMVSLGSGVVSLIFIPASIVAIIFGHIALREQSYREHDKTGRIVARIGLILGYLALVVGLVLVGLIFSQ